MALTRLRLNDGYSDDLISGLKQNNHGPVTRVVVLLPSETLPSVEARQIRLGADCTLRDPVRTEVLLEYLAKFRSRRHAAGASATPPKTSFPFAGTRVDRVDRQIVHGKRITRLTPREIDLAEALVAAEGQVASYHDLFSEILGRRFRGETSNLRVLLGLLDASTQRVGVKLRDWVEVIPKLGYRYRSTTSARSMDGARRQAKPRGRA